MSTERPDERVESAPHGMNRRQLIRAAGLAGVGAWMAPVILDSLASPAAAATLTQGCYRLYANVNLAGLWQGWAATQPANTGPACTPGPGSCSSFTTATPAVFAAVNTPTPSVTDTGSQLVTVSIKGGYSCRIVAISATVQAGADADTCSTGVTFTGVGTTAATAKPNGTTVEWDAAGGNTSMIGITIQCP